MSPEREKAAKEFSQKSLLEISTTGLCGLRTDPDEVVVFELPRGYRFLKRNCTEPSCPVCDAIELNLPIYDYMFYLCKTHNGDYRVLAGCRRLSIEEYRIKVAQDRKMFPHRESKCKATEEILDEFEKWIKEEA